MPREEDCSRFARWNRSSAANSHSSASTAWSSRSRKTKSRASVLSRASVSRSRSVRSRSPSNQARRLSMATSVEASVSSSDNRFRSCRATSREVDLAREVICSTRSVSSCSPSRGMGPSSTTGDEVSGWGVSGGAPAQPPIRIRHASSSILPVSPAHGGGTVSRDGARGC